MDLLQKYKESIDKIKVFFPKDSTDEPTLFTPWSLMHFGSGAYIYMYLTLYHKNTLLDNLIIMLVIHTIYELKDLYVTYFAHVPPGEVSLGGLVANSSLYNSIGDTISSVAGFYAIYYLHMWLKKGNGMKKNALIIIERSMFWAFLAGVILYNAMQKLG